MWLAVFLKDDAEGANVQVYHDLGELEREYSWHQRNGEGRVLAFCIDGRITCGVDGRSQKDEFGTERLILRAHNVPNPPRKQRE